MNNTNLNQNIKALEAQIEIMKKMISKRSPESVSDAILRELEPAPLTIVDLAQRLKTTKAIVNLAARKLANDGLLIMASETGKRVARFRLFLKRDFPQNWLDYQRPDQEVRQKSYISQLKTA